VSFNDLREFIAALEDAGQLTRIKVPVSAELEIAEITDRVSKGNEALNKALLFENVNGFDMPVLINALGSHERIRMALGVDELDEIGNRIRKLVKPKMPESLIDKLSMLPALLEIAQFPPKSIVGAAPCQEVVITDPEHPMLDKLPVITCWPCDAGPFVTLGAVITKNPSTGVRNVGVYRLQKYDNSTTGMHWHKHHDGARHFDEQRRANQTAAYGEPSDYADAKTSVPSSGARLEVAVAIGLDPAVIYAATAPLPPEIDEMVFAGFLRQKPVSLVACKTVDLEVPANAEIILEGYVNQSELRQEGPFGDHTGFYSLADLFPVFHLTAITHRRNPIYQTTIVGKPPQEDCFLGKATERIFLPLLQLLVPEIVDINLPWEGVFHNCAVISIDKRYPGHARKVMSAVWGLGQLMFTKYAIIVDKHVKVHDLSEVALNVFGNTDPRRDSMFVDGPLDILDHACDIVGFGSKVGIDATRKWPQEGFQRDWPKPIEMSQEIRQKVSRRWSEYGLGQVSSRDAMPSAPVRV
jgi:4-hydroxy-3-polyprenylbenzoate decarboxylase